MINTRVLMRVTAAAAVTILLAMPPAIGQPAGPDGPRGPGMMGSGFGPGMMMGPGIGPDFGPGMMGRRGQGRMCGPQAAGFAAWRIERLERQIKPTDAQRAKLEELKTASAKAAEMMQAACPAEWPNTPTGMMDVMEKRTETMLQAIKTVRPAMQAFYDSLTDEQKAQMTNGGPRGSRFWHWRDRF